MSGPYRFQQDSTRSPLDRQAPTLFPAGQPPSFKTNVNRAKTKKWVEAKKNAYDGDDWGEYDEYDEYGTEQAPPPAPPQQYDAPMGNRPRVGEPSRSFTDPTRQGPGQPARRNSFEAGDENRAFSAAYPQHAQGGYGEEHAPGNQGHVTQTQPVDYRQPGNRQASTAVSEASDTPQHRRDFSPSALPPPLQTRMSPAPGSSTTSPLAQFPPRKSSIGQVDSPSAMSPRDRAPSNPTKPLPFVRPADIYRRVEEERQRERASMDSSRPSLDSITGRPREERQGLEEGDNRDNYGKSADTSRSLAPLESVTERKSEYFPEDDISSAPATTSQAPATSSHQPTLPPVRGLSAFDNDFWSGDSQPQDPAHQSPIVSPPDDQGFRSVVGQAFVRSDDQRSVPPTPISKESDDSMSRSNTNSTSGISPIMSRVPSSGTAALRIRNQTGADGSTPVIAEEASETSTPISRPTSTAMLGGPHRVPRKPSPSHSRNVSSSSLPRTGLATPSPGESPARSPAIEPQRPQREPEAALLSSTSPEVMEGGLGGPSAAYATREADIATAMKFSPDQTAPGVGAATKESQDAFLESHQIGQANVFDTGPRSRSESPSKGRVQELAGKFGDVSNSRRGSTQSNASRSSVQSWERSQDNSRPTSPTKPAPLSERPVAEREASFRPKLPGQWESYATNVPTPLEQGDGHQPFPEERGSVLENNAVSSPLGDVDLTPTTDKHPISADVPSKSEPDPLTALKAAGSAIGDAISASVGPTFGTGPDNQEGQAQARSVGNVYLSGPVQFEQAASSVASSIPPTPPAKDTPTSEDLPPPPPLKEKSPEPPASSSQEQTPTRPTILPQLSTDPSDHDQESDRLRKEIVASLSPLRTSETAGSEPGGISLQPTAQSMANRESSLLPSEYDSYWADGDDASPRPSQDVSRTEPARSSVTANTIPAQSADAQMPSLLTRFSWENNTPIPDGQAQPGASAPSAGRDATATVEPQTIRAVPAEVSDGFNGSYFGPEPTAVLATSEAAKDAQVNVRAPSPPLETAKRSASPTPSDRDLVREASPTSGLHVVNSAINPEAVDMPPRLSAEASPGPQPSHEATSMIQPKSDIAEGTNPTSPIVPASSQATSQDFASKSPTGDKPLGFRDIVNIKSSSERIVTYNRTRDYWANADHGLNDWVASAMTANPGLASQTPSQPRPYLSSSATSRHKPTGSLSLFGKNHNSGGAAAQSTPYFEQYNSAASQVPGTPTSSAAPGHARLPGSSSGGPATRITSHQMQAKGKDLLHTAGVLGGKSMTGAKGLFAKGKSRFRASGSGDKDARSESAPSSREASEEPEWASSTTTPRMSMDTNESPKEAKKKRRLSSPFHRSSRSRSRPSSIVLPKNGFLEFGFGGGSTRNTPPRETPPAETRSRGISRPHSYHAPDAWNVNYAQGPLQSRADDNATTPPRSMAGALSPPERLGVLPSPAKSAFSVQQQDREGHDDVPPVPPIPDDVEVEEREREVASHRMLQSVIRYSTPPAMETYRYKETPTLGEDTVAGAPQSKPLVSAMKRSSISALEPGANGLGGAVQDESILLKNAATTSTSVPVPLGQVDDEDDLPPQLKYDPVSSKLHPFMGDTVDGRPLHGNQARNDNNKININHDDRIHSPHYVSHESREVNRDLDISPVVSSISAERSSEGDDDDGNDKERDRRPRLQVKTAMMVRGDVSPMLCAAEPDGRRSETPITSVHRSAQANARPAYETLQIGAGDVSPISTHRLDDDEDDVEGGAMMPINNNNGGGGSGGSGGSGATADAVGTDTMNKAKAEAEVDIEGKKTPSTARQTSSFAAVVDDAFGGGTAMARAVTGSAANPPIPPNPAVTGSPAVPANPATPGEMTPIAPQQQLHLHQHHQHQHHQQPGLGGGNLASKPPLQQRLSASPYVVHAVEYFSHSTSSLESWEQDSVAAPSQSEGSQLGDKHDERDAPPLPHSGPAPQQLQPAARPSQTQTQSPAQKSLNSTMPDIAIREHPAPPGPLPHHQDSQPQLSQLSEAAATTGKPSGHRRSQSLLSAISSAVSADGAPISPTSSLARSRPSSAGRQKQVSPAKTSPVPAQIAEEPDPTIQKPLAPPAAAANDYDLYADHDGVVKDVQDAKGQPLRVATVPAPKVSAPAHQPHPSVTKAETQIPSQTQDDDASRYSFERPMSFVSGPRDANGRPQDQINRPSTANTLGDIPPVPQIPIQLQGQASHQQHATSALTPVPAQAPAPAPAQVQAQAQVPKLEKQPLPNGLGSAKSTSDAQSGHQAVSPPNGSLRSQNTRSPPHSNVSSPPPSNASPPPQPTPPQVLSQRALLSDTRTPNGPLQDLKFQDSIRQDPRLQESRFHDQRLQDPRLQDPRLQDPRQDPRLQDPRFFQDPRMQDPRFLVDPRMHGIPPGQPMPQAPRNPTQQPGPMYGQDPRIQGQQMGPPRNEYERQQMMMRQQQQAVDPRLQSMQSNGPPPKQEEKSSSKPRFSSVFKGFGGKIHSHAAKTPTPPPNNTNSNPPPQVDPSRNASYQSGISALSADQLSARNQRRTSTGGPPAARPPSMGTESHISHVSQDSTRVQAADSRLDLRHPNSPAPFHGIPPQHPPPGAPMHSQPPAHQRPSTSGIPDAGKKKRFSALGGLFGRNMLTKDEKKAQKAQKHTTAPPMQSSVTQQWPSQIGQQQMKPQQYGMQYGPPLGAMRPIPPQGLPPQGYPPQRPPQQQMPPQGYQQQPMQPQRVLSAGSAYQDTRHIAQQHQTRQTSPHLLQQPGPGPHPINTESIPSYMDSTQRSPEPPREGYYKPDIKIPIQENVPSVPPPAPQQHLQPQQHPHQHSVSPPEPQSMRSVSSPLSNRGPNTVSPMSQRRVSSPQSDARYETPPIPAAYGVVHGAYVAPGAQSPVSNGQAARPPPGQYNAAQGRQYSDPNMQPISPQISGQSRFNQGQRNNSDSSSVSMVSPVVGPQGTPNVDAPPNQRSQNRMSSITEASSHERPWNLNLPAGATEQEIVRARQRQYMEQQIAHNQQMHAERTAKSPSPQPPGQAPSPISHGTPSNQQQPSPSSVQGGFREVLPRSTPHAISTNQPVQPAPIHPGQSIQPASYPLPMSPDSARSPLNPMAAALPPPPPPKLPHSPMRPDFQSSSPQPQTRDHPQQHQMGQQPDYDEQPPDEPPPSYSGPGMPDEGMEKERHRPPNIMTDAEIRGREPRQRQASIGILQHPTPATMAASPQRSSADMGADILRRQMLEQEERDRTERLQRAEIQRQETQREREEREKARARARELERSVSGGGRVSSLRSAQGSGRVNEPGGWVRRGSTARPVFELPAEEDDEPVMRATSFPGQEWVPTWNED